MKKLTNKELKHLQKIELEMLIEFDKICRKHKLKYVLAGGSCIGAIRHNGFIPWDDDIDIHMTRSDYNKFLKIQNKELNSEKYYFQSMEIDKHYPLIFGKIRRKDSVYAESISNSAKEEQGIWIDIFPCDNVPDNNLLMKWNFYLVTLLKIIFTNKQGNTSVSKNKFKSIILKLISLFSKIISLNWCKKRLIKRMTKYNNKKTERIICYGGRYLLKELLPTNYLSKRILHEFEEHKFYITKDYDKYLTFVYGDYMKLPPKEKRCSEHLISEIKFPESN